MLPIVVNERDIEPTVTEKANQFVSFKFSDTLLLDLMTFLDGATSPDNFLKTYRTNETKRFFPFEWFYCTEKLGNKELPQYDSFCNILHNSYTLEKDNNDFENHDQSGLFREQTLCK